MLAARLDGNWLDPHAVTYSSAALHRLQASSPLAEVVLDEVIWIRTEDGVIYPALCSDCHPLFGYDGSGSTTLAIVLEALLDDIGRAPVYRGTPDDSRWLLRIAQKKWGRGTVLTRAQLLTHIEHAGRARAR